MDIIAIVPHNLSWLVPGDAAEIWDVYEPMSSIAGWYDDLAVFVNENLRSFKKAYLATHTITLSYTAGDIDIERYTGIKPFFQRETKELLSEPRITIVDRGDSFRGNRPWILGDIEKSADESLLQNPAFLKKFQDMSFNRHFRK